MTLEKKENFLGCLRTEQQSSQTFPDFSRSPLWCCVPEPGWHFSLSADAGMWLVGGVTSRWLSSSTYSLHAVGSQPVPFINSALISLSYSISFSILFSSSILLVPKLKPVYSLRFFWLQTKTTLFSSSILLVFCVPSRISGRIVTSNHCNLLPPYLLFS